MQKDTKDYISLVIIKFARVFLLAVLLTITYGAFSAFADPNSLSGMSGEQADEKQDLEQMKQELSDIKNSIKEGMQGSIKLTHVL